MNKTIEIMIASPPERDELVAQIFVVDGGQWAEIYRENGVYMADIFVPGDQILQLKCEEVIYSMQKALGALKDRLEDAPDI
ncbi:hypothetical protein [Planctomicrobium sp. SH664]|uniref:hypothetical protein n=1 Tax=Planctomicrobium sp. SH664 TaxID=3448125 RepID=UPI003F5BC058